MKVSRISITHHYFLYSYYFCWLDTEYNVCCIPLYIEVNHLQTSRHLWQEKKSDINGVMLLVNMPRLAGFELVPKYSILSFIYNSTVEIDRSWNIIGINSNWRLSLTLFCHDGDFIAFQQLCGVFQAWCLEMSATQIKSLAFDFNLQDNKHFHCIFELLFLQGIRCMDMRQCGCVLYFH